MREYARQQTALLMGRLTVALERAARGGDTDSIHDVRVAMRRLSRCLRVFAPFYPDGADGPAKKIRHRIAALMAVAGAARDCDISLELVARAGVAKNHSMVARLALERRRTARALLLEIRRWKRHNFARRWRAKLELER